MLPTFNLTNEIVLVDKISTRRGKVGSGDVVILRSPENPRKVVTKRIIGMEGDSITYIVDPKISDRTETVVVRFILGQLFLTISIMSLYDEYIFILYMQVPKGHVWVQGDNIYNSRDSREFGAVPYGLLHGKVCWKVSKN